MADVANMIEGKRMRRSTTFSLCTERGEQLRALASFRRTTVASLIADWIDRDLSATGINDAVPNARVSLIESRTVLLEMEGFDLGFQAPADALSFANALTRCALRGGAFGMFLGGAFIEVRRCGSGVVVEAANERRSFSPNTAETISKHIRAVAQRANH